MKNIRRGGLFVLLFVIMAFIVTGCMPRGVANTGWTVLSVEGEDVYGVLSTGEAIALDRDDGNLVWHHPPESASPGVGCGIARPAAGQDGDAEPLGAVFGAPAITDELVLFGSFSGQLYALDRDSGQRVWTYEATDAIVGGITVKDGVAYFGATDGNVYALDIETRELVWDVPFRTADRVWGAPVVDDTRVYVGSMDRSIYAIDRQTRDLAWQAELGGAIPGDITLADGRIFAGSIDRHFYAFDAETGDLLWQTERLGGWIWGTPLVVEDGVYFTSLDGQVHAYDVQSGEPLWGPVALQGSVRAGVALWNDQIAVGTEDGFLYLIDIATGSPELIYGTAATEQQGALLTTPVVADDLLYLGSTLGRVVALDPTDRIPELWVYPPAGDN